MIKFFKLKQLTGKAFSTKIIDREKRLAQFFKLPKHDISSEQVIHRSSVSVLNTYNEEEIDKMDIMEKVIKRKKLQSENKMEALFSNTTNREAIKISENLVERMRLKKEFKFDENFKEK